MSELDGLVARPGVFVAGRFGPDRRVTQHKSAGLAERAKLGSRDDLNQLLRAGQP
jgi:roadblock/LC7 domain-containing protein